MSSSSASMEGLENLGMKGRGDVDFVMIGPKIVLVMPSIRNSVAFCFEVESNNERILGLSSDQVMTKVPFCEMESIDLLFLGIKEGGGKKSLFFRRNDRGFMVSSVEHA